MPDRESLADIIAQQQAEDDALQKRNLAKFGEYVNMDCKNCGRHRVMRGNDGQHRCEKCCWHQELDQYDFEFVTFSN